MADSTSCDWQSLQYSRDLLLDWMDDGHHSPCAADLPPCSSASPDLPLQLPASSDGFLFAAPLSPLATTLELPAPSETAPADQLNIGALQSSAPIQHHDVQLQPFVTTADVSAALANAIAQLSGNGAPSHSASNCIQLQQTPTFTEEQSTPVRAKRRKISPSTLAKLSSGLSAEALWEDIVSTSLLSCLTKRIADLEALALAQRDSPTAFVDDVLEFTATSLTSVDAAQFSAAFLSRPRVRQAIIAAAGAEEVQKLRNRVYDVDWQVSPEAATPDATDFLPRMPTMVIQTVSTQTHAEHNKLSLRKQVLVSAEYERATGLSQRDVTAMHSQLGNLAVWALIAPRDNLAAAHRNYQQQGKTAESELLLLTAMKQLARDVRRFFLTHLACVAEGRLQFSTQASLATRHGAAMRCQTSVRIFDNGKPAGSVSVSFCFAPLTDD